MSYSEEEMDKIIDLQEEAALKVFIDASGEAFNHMTESVQEALKNAFLIGYGYGGLEYEENLRKLQEDDPISFYKWIEHKL